MALVLPTIGPTAAPTHSGFHMPVSQREAGNVSNAPLVGIARTANANFQPVINLPQTLANMVKGFNPRPIRNAR